jgi:hypothetical protein
MAWRVFNNFQRLLEQCGEKSTAANVALGRSETRSFKPVADLGVGSGVACQFRQRCEFRNKVSEEST